ncbi:MAG: Eco57I restriction-modification methylase domain-containing protein [Actinomycetes bacterium]
MKTRDEVSAAKLRGGFYTPADLVQRTLDRARGHLPPTQQVKVLEPSAGDGAFLAGLATQGGGHRWDITAVELLEEEAAKCRATAEAGELQSVVHAADFLQWMESARPEFTMAVGNPPFVRFQFVSNEAKEAARRLAERLGVPSRGVSNLWVPVLLGAINLLEPGGAFAFVLPTECLTGLAAGSARSWLVRNSGDLTLDLFAPGSFPGVLQEVAILSGVRRRDPADAGTLNIVDGDSGRSWSHRLRATSDSWTRYLLTPSQLEAYALAQAVATVKRLDEVATFEVAAVTGANAFFSINSQTRRGYELQRWTTPLLPRIRHASGLVYPPADQSALQESAEKAWLLDFAEDRPDPLEHAGASRYIAEGEQAELHKRYKTRIRKPWFRIPLIRAEELLLSKRSHHHPRVVLNEAGAVTTDTIYRGWLTTGETTSRDFTAGFHNSLTMLSAEMEGRSFGGGVLELVPSEIKKLVVPVVSGMALELGRLDTLARECSAGAVEPDGLIVETNRLLAKNNGEFDGEVFDVLEDARRFLADRRHRRGQRRAD